MHPTARRTADAHGPSAVNRERGGPLHPRLFALVIVYQASGRSSFTGPCERTAEHPLDEHARDERIEEAHRGFGRQRGPSFVWPTRFYVQATVELARWTIH